MSSSLMLESVRAAAILAAAGLIVLMLRHSSAARRHFVWTLAVMGVLALPVLSRVLPAWAVPVLNGASNDVVITALPTAPVVQSGSVVIDDVPRVTSHAKKDAAVPTSPDARSVNAAQAKRAASWPLTLLAMWVSGAVCVLSYAAAGLAGAWRLTRRAEVVGDARILGVLASAASSLGVRRRVRVLLAPDAMPITWGYVRPVIVLPKVALQWSDQRLDTVLRHELAHIRRGDAFTQLAAQIVCAVHWYNPLAWVASARLRVERELACDDVMVTNGARPSDYAEELLDLARTFGRRREMAAAAVAMARPSSLRTRLTALFDERRTRARASRAFALPSTAAMALFVIPVSTILPVGRSSLYTAPALSSDAVASHDGVANAAKRGERKRADVSALVSTAISSVTSTSVTSAGNAVTDANDQEKSCLTRPGKNRSTNINNNDNDSYRIKYSASDCKGDVRIEGRIQYSDDFTRITGLSTGGYITIEEEDRGTTRRLEVRPSGSGLQYDWSVDGKSRSYDAEARAWFDAWTLTLFREFGFAANDRASAILKARGVDGVLDEVSQMQSDYVQSTYLGVVLEKGNLNAAALERVLNVVTTEIDSDYYMATALSRATKGVDFTPAARQSYLRAAAKIGSDYYKENVLSDLLKNGRLSSAEVGEVLRQATMIGSDYYQAELLGSVAGSYALDQSLRRAYLDAASKIESDYYKSGVLTRLLSQRELSAAELADVVAAARIIQSDYYKGTVLAAATSSGLNSQEVQDAVLATAASISGDYERYTAFSQIVKKGVSDNALATLLRSARSIASDYYQSELLAQIARKYTLRGAALDAFTQNMNSIGSDYYRKNVSAVLNR